MKALFSSLAILMMAYFIPAETGTFTLKGKVMDETGAPLIGASILVKGTSTGAVTDIDGTFAVGANNRCEELVFSYTGFQTETKKACEGDFVEIKLKPGAVIMQEVTVMSKEQKTKREPYRKSTSNATPKMDMSIGSTPSGIVSGYDREAPNFNTEDYDHIQENRFYKVTETPLSTFSIDVDAASYSNLRRFINNGQTPPADAVRIEEMVNYFDYEYPQPQGEHPFEVVTEIAACPWNSDNQLLLVGMQGKKIATEKLPPSNLVFLIDVSGSMNAMNKLPLLKSSLKMLVNNLREQDRVAITVYAGAAGWYSRPPLAATDKRSSTPSTTSKQAAQRQVRQASNWPTRPPVSIL